MLRHVRKPLGVLCLVLTALVVGAATNSLPFAAEGDQPAAEKPAKRRGRLPAYYGKVVTPEQREEIYQLQEEYAPQIEDLVVQLQTLIAERDSKVSGVLSPDQLKEVQQLRDAAREDSRGSPPAEDPAGE